MILDIIVVFAVYGLALWIVYNCDTEIIPIKSVYSWLGYAPFNCIVTILILSMLRQYHTIWKFAGIQDFLRVTIAVVVSIITHIIVMQNFLNRMPVAYYVIGGLLEYLCLLIIRFSGMVYLFLQERMGFRYVDDYAYKNTLIIGAGEAGKIILDEFLRNSMQHTKICCFIDDNKELHGKYLGGIPVVGGRDDILKSVEYYHVDLILFAIPSATAVQKRDILNICKESGCDLRTLPGIYQLVNGDVSISDLKEVSVEDLLGREPIKVELEQILQNIEGRKVLVTGGGGSIGSELCRQIAGHNPKQLIIFDIYENNAYDIQQELKEAYPSLELVVLIGSVRDDCRMRQVFEIYRPQLVYHAAAHKHVPLMEDSPCESIKNNVFGTYNVAKTAKEYQVERFVLISTDKAVNPTNIMGASKRLCEMIIQMMDKECKQSGQATDYVAVRFGNVLGSNGSVVPLFRKQIERGGPVTVTHPDIIRYFMTIPEAVSLVLQAGAYAKGGEIFILDMGEPVKIDDLARNLIKLSGYTPDIDIPIIYTGLRPGEKLYEEKLMAEEGIRTTPNNMIHIAKPIPFDVPQFCDQLFVLQELCQDNQELATKEKVAQMAGTYQCER
ncbi:MAG: polysaccharide biosynthesis protein [Clostridium sp.]|nr:polysaccharide biosynthesis protein [Clostridium sp.]